MKKMQIGFDMDNVKNAIDRMEYDLICMLEIDISNGIFVQNGMPIHIDGKVINYPKIEMTGQDKYSINYEPFSNRKIASFLFNRYAVIRQIEDPNFKIFTFSISKYLNNPNYLYAICKSNKGEFISQPFTNESVCLVNLIYIMEQEYCDFDLFTNIDTSINMERLMAQQKKKEELKNEKQS